MQIYRLFEIVYLLLNQKHTTAKTLAEHFEVSTRTIFRDIEVLSSSGIPVYTLKGKGGGIFIHDCFVLNKTIISEEEQEQILFALQSISATKENDINDVDAILSKLSALFNHIDVNWVEIDFSSWGNKEHDKSKFELLKQSITKRQVIQFIYTSSSGEKTERKVYPLKLFYKSKAWYLQGYCSDKLDYRLFRLSRLSSLLVTLNMFDENQFSPPSLASINEKSTHADYLHVVMRIAPYMAYRVYDEFDMRSITIDENGFFLITADLPNDYWLYNFVLSLGASVQVIEPQVVINNILAEIDNMKNIYI